MIFVTVGTHEQSFNRLVKTMDLIAKSTKERVFIQTGYSTYIPKYADYERFIDYEKMQQNYNDARIIVTHGGPSSFLDAIRLDKVPIVVPRQKKYDEHINNHQVDFCKKVERMNKNIIVLLDESTIKGTIKNYNKIVSKMGIKDSAHNKLFMEQFEKAIELLFENKA